MLETIRKSIVDGTDYTYVRNHSKEVDAMEEKLAGLYGASHVLLTSSGMAAISTFFDSFPIWDEEKRIDWNPPFTILMDRNTYYETRELVEKFTPHKVIYLDFKKMMEEEHPKDWEKIFSQVMEVVPIQIVYLDYPDFFGTMVDLRKVAHIAHQKGAILMVDNSILSIGGADPLTMGADIVVESYTKYVMGHGDCMAGGIIFGHSEGAHLAYKQVKRRIGRAGRYIPPETLYLIDRGLETLDIRLGRHTQSAKKIRDALVGAGHTVLWAGKGGSLILPGKKQDFCKGLEVFRKLPTFGTTYSTWGYVRSPDYYTVGDYVRLFVGLEPVEILLEDLSRAGII